MGANAQSCPRDDAVEGGSEFASRRSVGSRLAAHNTVMVIGDTVFAHGGLLPQHVDFGLDRINRAVRRVPCWAFSATCRPCSKAKTARFDIRRSRWATTLRPARRCSRRRSRASERSGSSSVTPCSSAGSTRDATVACGASMWASRRYNGPVQALELRAGQSPMFLSWVTLNPSSRRHVSRGMSVSHHEEGFSSCFIVVFCSLATVACRQRASTQTQPAPPTQSTPDAAAPAPLADASVELQRDVAVAPREPESAECRVLTRAAEPLGRRAALTSLNVRSSGMFVGVAWTLPTAVFARRR